MDKTLEGILTEGPKQGLSPLELAGAVKAWRNDNAKGIYDSTGDDHDVRLTAIRQLDADAQEALDATRAMEVQRHRDSFFKDAPEEAKPFVDAFTAAKYDPEALTIPQNGTAPKTNWKGFAQGLRGVLDAEDFSLPQGTASDIVRSGSINNGERSVARFDTIHSGDGTKALVRFAGEENDPRNFDAPIAALQAELLKNPFGVLTKRDKYAELERLRAAQARAGSKPLEVKIPTFTNKDVEDRLAKNSKEIAAIPDKLWYLQSEAEDVENLEGKQQELKNRREELRRQNVQLKRDGRKFLQGEAVRDEILKPENKTRIQDNGLLEDVKRGAAGLAINTGIAYRTAEQIAKTGNTASLANPDAKLQELIDAQGVLKEVYPGAVARHMEGGLGNDILTGAAESMPTTLMLLGTGGITRALGAEATALLPLAEMYGASFGAKYGEQIQQAEGLEGEAQAAEAAGDLEKAGDLYRKAKQLREWANIAGHVSAVTDTATEAINPAHAPFRKGVTGGIKKALSAVVQEGPVEEGIAKVVSNITEPITSGGVNQPTSLGEGVAEAAGAGALAALPFGAATAFQSDAGAARRAVADYAEAKKTLDGADPKLRELEVRAKQAMDFLGATPDEKLDAAQVQADAALAVQEAVDQAAVTNPAATLVSTTAAEIAASGVPDTGATVAALEAKAGELALEAAVVEGEKQNFGKPVEPEAVEPAAPTVAESAPVQPVEPAIPGSAQPTVGAEPVPSQPEPAPISQPVTPEAKISPAAKSEPPILPTEAAHEEFTRRAADAAMAGNKVKSKALTKASTVIAPLLKKWGRAFTGVRFQSGLGTSAAVSGQTLLLDPDYIADGLASGALSPKSLESTIHEEVIHPSVDQATARMIATERDAPVEDITINDINDQHAKDWQALPKRVQQESERLYRLAPINKARKAKGSDLTEAELEKVIADIGASDSEKGAEFKRQVLQGRIFGILTEEAQARPDFAEWLKKFLNELLASIKNITAKLTDPAARKMLDDLERDVRAALAKISAPVEAQEATPPERKPRRSTPRQTIGDILDEIDASGGLLSATQARKVMGEEWWEQNKSLYDDAPRLANPAHNFIYSRGGVAPDKMLQALQHKGRMNPGDEVPQMWAVIERDSKSRASLRGQQAAQTRNDKEGEKQAKAFGKATASGDMAVTSWDLQVGDTLDIEGESVKVVGFDEETGDAILQDGTRFGRQRLATGDAIYVEKFTKSGDAAALELEQQTPKQIEQERAKEKQRAEIKKRQEAPLKGSMKAGDAVPDMFDSTAGATPLFSQPATKPTEPSVDDEIAAQRAKIQARLKGKLGRTSLVFSPIDPRDLADYTKLGYLYLKKGTMSFKDWSAQMLEDIGETVREHLKNIWDTAHGYLGSTDEQSAVSRKDRNDVSMAPALAIIDQEAARDPKKDPRELAKVVNRETGFNPVHMKALADMLGTKPFALDIARAVMSQEGSTRREKAKSEREAIDLVQEQERAKGKERGYARDSSTYKAGDQAAEEEDLDVADTGMGAPEEPEAAPQFEEGDTVLYRGKPAVINSINDDGTITIVSKAGLRRGNIPIENTDERQGKITVFPADIQPSARNAPEPVGPQRLSEGQIVSENAVDSKTQKPVAEAIAASKTAKESLEVVAQSNSKYAGVAGLLLKMRGVGEVLSKVRMTFTDGQKPAYWHEGDNVELGTDATYHEPVVAVHEALHALTAKRLIRLSDAVHEETGEAVSGSEYRKFLEKAANDPQFSEGERELARLYLHAVEALGEGGKVFSDSNFAVNQPTYGLSNLHEFVSEAFTNEEFRNRLASVKVEGGKRTLWEQFVEAIRKLIGLTTGDNTLLDEVIRSSLDVVAQGRPGKVEMSTWLSDKSRLLPHARTIMTVPSIRGIKTSGGATLTGEVTLYENGSAYAKGEYKGGDRSGIHVEDLAPEVEQEIRRNITEWPSRPIQETRIGSADYNSADDGGNIRRAPEPVGPELPKPPFIRGAIKRHGLPAVQQAWDQLQSDIRLLQNESKFLEEASAKEKKGPTEATKDKRTYAATGERVDLYREPIPDVIMRATTQRVLGTMAWLHGGGYSAAFGKQVMAYLRDGKAIGGVLPEIPVLQVVWGMDVLEDDVLRGQLGLRDKDMKAAKKAISTEGTSAGRVLRAMGGGLYDPIVQLREDAQKDTNTRMKKDLGIEAPEDLADDIKDEVEKATKEEIAPQITPEIKKAVVEDAKIDADLFAGAMSGLTPQRQGILAKIKALLLKIRDIKAKLGKKLPPGAKSAPEPVGGEDESIEDLQAELDKAFSELGDMLDQWNEGTKPKRKTKPKAEEVEAEAEEIVDEAESEAAAQLTFEQWVAGEEQAGVPNFDDLILEHINANGFERDAFAESLANKFENVDMGFIRAVTDRIANLLEGKEQETESADAPDYDARAKRIVARSIAQDSMPPPTDAQTDPLNALIQKRLKGEINGATFTEQAKKLGIDPQSAFALNRKVERDIRKRKDKKEAQALAKVAANAQKARKKSVEKALNKLKKPKVPNLPKTNKFVEALLHSLDSGILDERTVRDSFTVAYDLHGLTTPRLEKLAKLLRDIGRLRDGQVKQTLLEVAYDVINDMAPPSTLMSQLYNNLMGGVLGGSSTMVSQFSGLSRAINPMQGAWQFLAMANPRALANPVAFFKVWARYLREMAKGIPMVAAGVQGTLGGKTYGLGVSPSSLAGFRPNQSSIGRRKVSELWKHRIGRQAWLRSMLGTEPQSRTAQIAKTVVLFPSWMASRSMALIRGAEAWSGNVDKNMAFRALAVKHLTDGGMSFGKAWNTVNGWLDTIPDDVRAQADKELADGKISKFALNQRVEELMQDRLDDAHKLDLENRHREISAWLNFKSDPLSKAGHWFSKDVMQRAPTPVKMLFLFSRFFSNVIERAVFNTPLGFIHMGKERAAKGAMSRNEKQIEAIFGSLENYRKYRNGLASASVVATFMTGTAMALAWALWKWMDEDDEPDKPPPFWITGSMPPNAQYATGRQLEAQGWWKPTTLYIRVPGTDAGLEINYVQANPDLAISLNAIGNMADRIMFPEMLNYTTDERTGERQSKGALKNTVMPMVAALAAPASRSTYATFQQAISRSFDGNPQSLMKLLGRPIGETMAATTLGGPVTRDIAKLAKPEIPRASQTSKQAFVSGIPFADKMGLDTGLPMHNQFGEPVSPFAYFPFFSNVQESSLDVMKAAKLLNDIGITKNGPEEWMIESDLVELSNGGKRYLLTLDERGQVLGEIGKEFVTRLNDKADKIRDAGSYDESKSLVQKIQTDAREKVLRRWREKIKK